MESYVAGGESYSKRGSKKSGLLLLFWPAKNRFNATLT
jgi:hypothetical protein